MSETDLETLDSAGEGALQAPAKREAPAAWLSRGVRLAVIPLLAGLLGSLAAIVTMCQVRQVRTVPHHRLRRESLLTCHVPCLRQR